MTQLPMKVHQALADARSKQLRAFAWRDRYGQHWPPELMETRHLFFTLRMIWNHTMPEEAKLRPFQAYDLRYSDEYLAQAVHALAAELATRKDMQAGWEQDLAWMINWLSTPQLEH